MCHGQGAQEVHMGWCSGWTSLQLEEPDKSMNVRTCMFGRSDVYLMEDFAPHLLRHDRCKILEIEIYDRCALPEEHVLSTATNDDSEPGVGWRARNLGNMNYTNDE